MKLSKAATIAGLVSSASAHATFQYFWPDATTSTNVCVRPPASNSPVGTTATTVACNVNGDIPAQGTCTAAAGSTVAVEMHQQPGDRDCSTEAIGGNHDGPTIIYLAKVDDASTAIGTQVNWFKIAQTGLVAANPAAQNYIWGTDVMNSNCGKVTFTIPADILPGQYLLRAEVIALHVAGSVGGAQHYMSCYQLNITGNGSNTPAGVKFPGAYSPTDPGILFNLYTSFTTYTVPGPTVYEGQPQTVSLPPGYGGGGGATTTKTSTSARATNTSSIRTASTTTSARSTSTSTRTSTSSASGTLQTAYGQCGGQGWNGPTANSNDYHVAFKIKVKQNRLEKYTIQPNVGILAPQSAVEIRVRTEIAPDTGEQSKHDRLLIEQAILAPGDDRKTTTSVWEAIKRERRDIYQKKLSIAYATSNGVHRPSRIGRQLHPTIDEDPSPVPDDSSDPFPPRPPLSSEPSIDPLPADILVHRLPERSGSIASTISYATTSDSTINPFETLPNSPIHSPSQDPDITPLEGDLPEIPCPATPTHTEPHVLPTPGTQQSVLSRTSSRSTVRGDPTEGNPVEVRTPPITPQIPPDAEEPPPPPPEEPEIEPSNTQLAQTSSTLTTTSNNSDDGAGEWVLFFPSSYQRYGHYRKKGTAAFAYGGFSDVWVCEVRYVDGTMEEVAVKQLRPVNMQSSSQEPDSVLKRMLMRLKREVIVWMMLQHSNVVPLIGFTFDPDFCLISPWYSNGNIRDYIQKYPGCDRLKLIHEVATGLAYLHSREPAIVHGDIKSDNVLVDANGCAAIIDFGLSKAMEPVVSYTSSLRDAGNTRWMAPELVKDETCTRCTSTDVYSFGSLAWEIYAGELPHKECSRDMDLYLAISEGQKPVADISAYPNLEPALWELLSDCWASEPEKRPSMHDVEARITALRDHWQLI
ncbi:hypothetical protein FRB99_000882 [Tulasnella sp. 403]|nr:hypothetical protein FRB99_000882 [Tulasnella sp. 403]